MAVPIAVPIAIAAGSAAGKMFSEYLKPDKADLFKDFPSFEDNPALMKALQDAHARSRDPNIYEQAVRSAGKQYGRSYARQVESIRQAYGDKPALFNRALQRVQENYANVVSDALDKAFIREEEAKETARGDVMRLGGLKLQSDTQVASMKAQAEYEDKVRLYNMFSGFFGEGEKIGFGMLGEKLGGGE